MQTRINTVLSIFLTLALFVVTVVMLLLHAHDGDRISGLKTQVTKLEQQEASDVTRFDTMDAAATDLGNKVKAVSGADRTTDVATLQSDIAGLNKDIEALQAADKSTASRLKLICNSSRVQDIRSQLIGQQTSDTGSSSYLYYGNLNAIIDAACGLAPTTGPSD